ncbi:MAG TPA: DUF559 domain-containing protein [Myxococcales bacterium]
MELESKPKSTQPKPDPRMPAKRARKKLGQLLRNKRLGETDFQPWHPVGPYTLDFYSPELKLAVEVDEPPDLFAGDRDVQRQAHLLEFGVRSVRLQAEALGTDLEGCLQRVAEAIRTIRDLS